MTLSIKKANDGDNNLLKLIVSGDLDIYTSNKFKEEVLSQYRENKTSIDLEAGKLNYVDSTGLGVLISILKEVKEDDNNIYISNAKQNIRKIFDITELDKMFIFRGEEDAE